MSRWMPILGIALTAFLLLSDLSAADTPKFSAWSLPVNLGPVVNSPFADQGPAISKDGLSLYFSSIRPTDPEDLGLDYNIWVAQRPTVDSPWGAPVLVPVINRDFREFIADPAAPNEFTDNVPALSRDGHWLFFNSRRPTDPGDTDIDFNIWASFRIHTQDDFGWQPPINLGPGVNSTSNDVGAGFFENYDGVPLLFFASNRPGGLGGNDIYVSKQLPDRSFGPANRVAELSSPRDDQRPVPRFDGLELFLFSNRAGTCGDRDLYVATRDTVAEPWSAPENLGCTINTIFDDQQGYIASDRETLFFASDRPGGFGDLDLYMTTRTR